MIIIPAIDIIGGQCVRLTKGVYDTKTVYSDSPVEVAKRFEGAGLTHLHLVDLDGARAKHIVNAKVLEAIATQTNLQVDFGGGIKSERDLQTAFDCGAAQVTLGSIAVVEPQLVLEFVQDFTKKGFTKVLCTDVNKDGMLAGPSLKLYRELLNEVEDLSLIASGGVSTMEDLYACRKLGCSAAVVGKAIYEGKIGLEELEIYQLNQS